MHCTFKTKFRAIFNAYLCAVRYQSFKIYGTQELHAEAKIFTIYILAIVGIVFTNSVGFLWPSHILAVLTNKLANNTGISMMNITHNMQDIVK